MVRQGSSLCCSSDVAAVVSVRMAPGACLRACTPAPACVAATTRPAAGPWYPTSQPVLHQAGATLHLARALLKRSQRHVFEARGSASRGPQPHRDRCPGIGHREREHPLVGIRGATALVAGSIGESRLAFRSVGDGEDTRHAGQLRRPAGERDEVLAARLQGQHHRRGLLLRAWAAAWLLAASMDGELGPRIRGRGIWGSG